MNSSNVQPENKENSSFQNSSSFSKEDEESRPPSSKKRKHSMMGGGVSSVSEIQLKAMKFEIESLRERVTELENDISDKEEPSTDMKETIKKLEAENTDLRAKIEEQKCQYKIEIDLLHSTSDNYLLKIKAFENKEKELEEKVAELHEKILSMQTIKSEIKDSVEEERESAEAAKDKLNFEIEELKKKNCDLEQSCEKNLTILNDLQKNNENLKMENDKIEKKIKELEEDIHAAKDLLQKNDQNLGEEKISLQTIINDLKAENDKFCKKTSDLETAAKEYKQQLSDYKKEIADLKDQKEEAEKNVKAFEAKLRTQNVEEQKQAFCSSTKDKMKNLEEPNTAFKKAAQEDKKLLVEWEAKYKKLENDFSNLSKKYGNIKKEKNENQKKLDSMKTEIDELTKKNDGLVNNNKTLQNTVDEQKKEIKSLKENEYVSLQRVTTEDDSNVDLSLLSCNGKKILIVEKFEGVKDGMFCSSVNKETRHFISYQDFRDKCFKLNITREFLIQKNCTKFKKILPRLYLCRFTKLHLCNQIITLEDFSKLVESKKVQICILEKVSFGSLENIIFKVLQKLPCVEEFQFKFRSRHCSENAAAGLEELDFLPNLKEFKLSNLSHLFKLDELSDFIDMNENVCYILQFYDLKCKSNQIAVNKSEKRLKKFLISAFSWYSIAIEYNKDLL